METEENIFLERTKITEIDAGGSSPFPSEVRKKSVTIIDKETGDIKLVRLVDDFFYMLSESLTLDGEDYGNNKHIMWFTSNDKVIVMVQTFDLVEMLNSTDRSLLSDAINEKLNRLSDLDEQDNPVLFVFTRKDQVVID